MANIIIAYSKDNHAYEITNKDYIEDTKAFIKSYQHKGLVITNDDEYHLIYKNRTELNNKVKEIGDTRKQAVKTIVGTFENQCKEITSLLIEAANEMTQRLETYKPRKREVSFKMSIKVDNANAYKKIKEFATKLGAEIKEDQ